MDYLLVIIMYSPIIIIMGLNIWILVEIKRMMKKDKRS